MNKRLLLTLFAGVLLAALDIAVLGPAQPGLRAEFSITPRAASWMITIYVLANLVGTPLLGHLSDRQGRRSIYMVSIGLFAMGSLGMVLGKSFSMLLLARALQGFGSGGLFPVASAVIGETVPPAQQGRTLGLLGATFGLAFLVGPPLGGILLHFAGWRWIFGINLPLAAFVLYMAWTTMPVGTPRSSKLDLWGLLSFAGGLILLSLGLSSLSPDQEFLGIGHLGTSLPLVLGILLLAITPWVERHAKDPLVHPDLLQSKVLRMVFLLGLGAGLGEVGVILLPDLAVQALDMAKDKASFLLIPLVLGLTVGAPLSGKLLDRIGARPVVVFGVVCQAGSLAAFGWLPTSTLLYDVAGPILGIGLACLLAGPLRWLLLRHAPAERLASSQSLLSLTHSVGQIATSALLGAVATTALHGVGQRHAFLVAGAFSLLLLIPAFALPEKAIA
jgi:EmrB/QacA subfamily drug resistance transporter